MDGINRTSLDSTGEYEMRIQSESYTSSNVALVPRDSHLLFSQSHHTLLRLKIAGEDGNVYDDDELHSTSPNIVQPWRVRDRLKTVSVALVLCLNIGVDPPDVVKPDPCARLECWKNPLSMQPQKALDAIAKNLQLQYERWQPRARYKTSTDPTVEEVKKLCVSLRKTAKEERVLFHYNGHGVPRPTVNGEIWVFNKNYTQYIPLSVYDLQTWMDTPSIYVFDCSSAGLIVSAFKQFCAQRELEAQSWAQQKSAEAGGRDKDASQTQQHQFKSPYRDCILLAACQGNELLPTNPDLPADLFTACLTTPIKTALRWFAPRSLLQNVSVEMLDEIPGKLNDRKTPLGELNWIFTAITDTIAWNVLPRPLFKRLFRQDLLVASLFRNFLLAERILWTANCTPISEPCLPPTHNHSLWQAWDYTVEQCLAQLPAMLAAEEAATEAARAAAASVNGRTTMSNQGPSRSTAQATAEEPGNYSVTLNNLPAGNVPFPKPYPLTSDRLNPIAGEFSYVNIPFFEDQMTAFEVWLAMGPQERSAPEQLPIVLQVLLSQSHRLRALKLLSRFLQIGPWAIDLALSVGIFPYVLKLLQSPAPELRQELVYIWGKILALDRSCEVDLVKDGGHVYFVEFLSAQSAPPHHLGMAAFVLSAVAMSAPNKCLSEPDFISSCVSKLVHDHPFVRRWSCLCLSRLLPSSLEALDYLIKHDSLVSTIISMTISDPNSDVRAAACNFTGHLFACSQSQLSTIIETRLDSARNIGSDSRGTEEPSFSVLGRKSSYREDPSTSSQPNPPVNSTSRFDDAPSEEQLNILFRTYSSICSQALDTFGIVCEDDSSALVRREVIFALSPCLEARSRQLSKLVDSDSDINGFQSPSTSQPIDIQICLRAWKLIRLLSMDAHPIIACLGHEIISKITGKDPAYSTRTLPNGTQDSPETGPAVSMREKDSRMEPVSVITSDPTFRILLLESVHTLIRVGSDYILGLTNADNESEQTSSGTPESQDQKSPSNCARMSAEQTAYTFQLGSPDAINAAAKLIPSLYEWSCRDILRLESNLQLGTTRNSFKESNEQAHMFPSSSTQNLGMGSGLLQMNLEQISKGSKSQFLSSTALEEGSISSTNSGKLCEIASFELFRGGIWSMAFAPTEPVVAIGTSLGNVLLFDYESWSRTEMLGVARLNVSKTRGITTVSAVAKNGDQPIYAAGSSDGLVALWKRQSNYSTSGGKGGLTVESVGEQKSPRLNMGFRLVSTFNAACRGSVYSASSPGGLSASESGYGFLMGWNLYNDCLLSGGSEGALIRLWDIGAERCIWLGAAFSGTATVTALCVSSDVSMNSMYHLNDSRIGNESPFSDYQDAHRSYGVNVHAMGASDGSVAILDDRAAHSSQSVMCIRSHRAPVVALGLQSEESKPLLCSADIGGSVQLWDLRMFGRGAFRSLIGDSRGKLTSMVMRTGTSDAQIVTGSAYGSINLLSMDGQVQQNILFHEGFLSTRIGPVTSLAQHPTRNLLATGFGDSVVTFYGF